MPPPQSAKQYVDAVFEADGLIWSSPMYHGRSAVRSRCARLARASAKRDPPYLTDKVVGLISSAGGVQGLQAVNTMEYVARSLRAFAIPLVVPIAASTAFDERCEIVDERVANQLRRLGEEVAEICLRRRHD